MISSCDGGSHGCAGRVVKGDQREVSHVQPMVMEVLIKVLLQTGNGGSRVEVHPQMIDVNIRWQTEGLKVGSRDVEGVSALGNGHERVNIGVKMHGVFADNTRHGLLWNEERPGRCGHSCRRRIRHHRKETRRW